jgi:hypothetical protein
MNLVTKKYLNEQLSDLSTIDAADKTKLDGIEENATADQTAAEIKTAYESNEDTNAYSDADKALLTLIKGAAKGDLFISNGAASLTKIAVPTAASTLAHTGVADSVPYWKADV